MVSSFGPQGASFAPDFPSAGHNQRAPMHGLDLTDDRIQNLKINVARYDHAAALDMPSSTYNCFSRTTVSMHSKCADIDTNQDARVDASISMTLCEIATAMHHSVPRECQLYSSERGVASEISPNSRGECVDALARSAQYWATYSGYLREIPQLCYAYTRWNDIDLARDIYHNITTEKVALIKFLFEHEDEQRHLSRDFASRLLYLQELASKVFEQVEKQEIKFDDSLSKVNEAVVEGLSILIHGTQGIQEADQQLLHEQISNTISLLHNQLALAVVKIEESLKESTKAYVQILQAERDIARQHTRELMSISESHWNAINSQTAGLAHSISTVSELVELLEPNLRRATQQLELIRTKNVDLSHSTEWLQMVVSNMTAASILSMQKFEASAQIIQEKLRLPSFQLYGLFKSSILHSIMQVSQVEGGKMAVLIVALRLIFKLPRSFFSQTLSIILGIFWALRFLVMYAHKIQAKNYGKEDGPTRRHAAPTSPHSVKQEQNWSVVVHTPRVSGIPDRLCITRSRRF